MHIANFLKFDGRVRSWRSFNRRIAVKDRNLLRELPRFPGAVLVAGCQRSGTTILTRVISAASNFSKFEITHDDELDAALILSGEEPFDADSRVCFQTTYLNDSYQEYLTNQADFRLVWVIRNPYSIVYSMVHHWRNRALNELYRRCGKRVAAAVYGNQSGAIEKLSKLEKACFAYIGKSQQLEHLVEALPSDKLLVIDYDALCLDSASCLPAVFAFIEEPFEPRYAEMIHTESISKGSLLTEHERSLVTKHCRATYERSVALATSIVQPASRQLPK